jgi:tripartite ATP-independent transporter DctM subunit
MSGISGTGMAILGVLALPYMLKRGYDKTISMGPIMAGAALAFLIPPSGIAIIYGALVRVSIGKLFLGGIIPGFILATLYIVYIGVRCWLKPELAPPLPPEDRVSFTRKVISLRSVILPAFIIMGCLGTIFMGIASPTEAAAVGAAGAVISAAIYRRLNWTLIKHATYETFRITGMVMWILIGAFAFKAVFVGVGGPAMVSTIISGLGLTPIQTIILMQITYIFLGCFLDDLTIMMVSFPVFIPIVSNLGFDLVWFGVLFAVNMQIAYLTPPLGFCLFYMKGVAPPQITMTYIYKAIIPFIPLQIVGLVIVMLNPQLVLWLPNMVFD